MRQPDRRAYPLVDHAIKNGQVGTREQIPVDNLASHDVANDARLSVCRAAKHFNVSVSCWVTDASGENCYRSCKDPAAPHGIRFMLFSKNEARGYIAAKAKGDPSSLKYNPFKRDPKLDDDGNQFA